jgi:hypothetical protein
MNKAACLRKLVGRTFATKLLRPPKAVRGDRNQQQALYSSFVETASTSHGLPTLVEMRWATWNTVCTQGLSSQKAHVGRVKDARLHHACRSNTRESKLVREVCENLA